MKGVQGEETVGWRVASSFSPRRQKELIFCCKSWILNGEQQAEKAEGNGIITWITVVKQHSFKMNKTFVFGLDQSGKNPLTA